MVTHNILFTVQLRETVNASKSVSNKIKSQNFKATDSIRKHLHRNANWLRVCTLHLPVDWICTGRSPSSSKQTEIHM